MEQARNTLIACGCALVILCAAVGAGALFDVLMGATPLLCTGN